MSEHYDAPDLDLDIRPDCPVCDHVVDGDGSGWWCEECGTNWNARGQRGQLREPMTQSEQPPSTTNPEGSS